MEKQPKYIIPIALIKIVLIFLVMQLFFSSCEEGDILYSSETFAEGPVFEIPVSFGADNSVFNTGDTILLEIVIESSSLEDEISGDQISVSQASFEAHFKFCDAEGQSYYPTSFLFSGQSLGLEDGAYVAYFGNSLSKGAVLSSTGNSSFLTFEAGYVFNTPGEYTLYFINTPNAYVSEGETDILLSEEDDSWAYAVYLFDLGETSDDYATEDDEIKWDILQQASFEQAIKDFIIIDNVE